MKYVCTLLVFTIIGFSLALPERKVTEPEVKVREVKLEVGEPKPKPEAKTKSKSKSAPTPPRRVLVFGDVLQLIGEAKTQLKAHYKVVLVIPDEPVTARFGAASKGESEWTWHDLPSNTEPIEILP